MNLSGEIVGNIRSRSKKKAVKPSIFQEDPDNRMYVLPIDNSYEEPSAESAGAGTGTCASEELGTDMEVASFSHFLGMSLVHAIS